MELFISGNCGVQYTYSIAYYSGMREEDMEHVIKHIWPLLVQKKFGVTVRCNKTRKLVAALLNCDHMDKTKFKQWAGISYPSKYRMEMIDQMDLVFRTKTMLAKALELARGAGFKSMYLMVFDHVSEEFVVDLFGFEVIEIMHVNQFVSSDGVIPFHLVPDYVCGTVLYKKL
ncbi:hypothetical protein Ocin01_18478 [Orchesella cincta]|uniref:Uncharacterized protein n=1 Tax=Orchesella cincta TaxID=48709 RepID=A0A1D2M5L8_ORCCI|nr:hypothetical protein Ocin01_18478 [Orchesella cincta]